MTFPLHLVRLTAERSLELKQAVGLRGYYGTSFGHNPQMAKFLESSQSYRYPRLQYKVVDGRGLILGLAEAAAVLARLPYPETLHLGNADLVVTEASSHSSEGRWELTLHKCTYRWLTPWLILDDEGLAKYFRLKSAHSQTYFLESLLISNLLAISKELGYRPEGQIDVKIEELKPSTIEIRGRPTMGFWGTFSANMEIPDYFGLGRSVARGYGAVRKI